MTQVDAEISRQLYNIKDSSWTSPKWNWGSARGTGHDCAAICRRRWSDKVDRQKLVDSLVNPAEYHCIHGDHEVPFEEIKLILGLYWQRCGRSHAFNNMLDNMARAKRYEVQNDEITSALNFITDVKECFPYVARSKSDIDQIDIVAGEILQYHENMVDSEKVFRIRRVCAGMVLEAMGFVQNGI